MNKIKKLLTAAILLLSSSFIFAASAVFTTDNYNLNISYNDIIIAGDAIFVRLNIVPSKNLKKIKQELEVKAVLQLYQDKKSIETAPFYLITKKKKDISGDYLAGVPASLWLEENNYSITITLDIGTQEPLDFTLPLKYEKREFIHETIDLNDSNTAIKTDNSPERMAQIEKLNNILFTTMTSDVFSLKSFQTPVNSTRYTAYCGDRRVYAYSNGKSSTNLHYGNDYGVPEGTEVKACAAGKVVMAENRISTGWSIVIEHLPGLYSLYYHLSEMNVKEGDMVKSGDLIGKSGCTGLATGPHLHWEVRLNGSAVKPEFFTGNFTFEPEN